MTKYGYYLFSWCFSLAEQKLRPHTRIVVHKMAALCNFVILFTLFGGEKHRNLYSPLKQMALMAVL
jgi:hypothetical protein